MSAGEWEQAKSIRYGYKQDEVKVLSLQALTANKRKQEDIT